LAYSKPRPIKKRSSARSGTADLLPDSIVSGKSARVGVSSVPEVLVEGEAAARQFLYGVRALDGRLNVELFTEVRLLPDQLPGAAR
jgi:hypothetical protein